MSRRILVSSNCQTAGIATALQYIFPKDEVAPIPLSNLSSEDDVRRFTATFDDASVWVTAGRFEVFEKYYNQRSSTELKLVRVPIVTFSAFHPDCTYLQFKDSGAVLSPHYNSGIVAWSYLQNLDVEDCLRLFNKQVFAELGYLCAWDASVRTLQKAFSTSDVDFNLFMPRIKRTGVFMHTINHPKIVALARIAQIAACKMGASPDVLEQEIEVLDGLAALPNWPVYPEIGDSLAVSSAYLWRLGSGNVTLSEYIAAVYTAYENLDLKKRGVIFSNGLQATYDRVLGMKIGITA